eukprot:CAMPEP_0169384538 /NCGR_PEP_ID=MMETSP1017-20121227/43493_1 /TAXON_ID=342587 /ORGANISM="Karlodinium micrum, Strain CCMP2283" /LENGTH=152 /DNA_ID=CAMNT_0009485127 /DNA_START=52 /DNA_END=507 /DNA_ORIENTATION=+
MVGSLGKSNTIGNAGRSSVTVGSLPEDNRGSSGNLANRVGLTDVLMGRATQTGLTGNAAWGNKRGNQLRGSAQAQSTAAVSSGTLKLPSWIKIDAHLSYQSKTLQRNVEAIVEMVDNSRMEVELSFTDSPARKVLPFSVICSSNNPLLGVWT